MFPQDLTLLVLLKSQNTDYHGFFFFYLFRDMYKRFSAIFTITQNPAKVVIPESFAEKVKGWLGGNIELFNNVKDQV